MGRRQKKSPTFDSQTRRVTPNLKEAKNDVLESPGHQDPETTDEEHAEGDVAQDEATVVQSLLPEPATEGDAPTDESLGGVEHGDNVSEAETDDLGQATPEAIFAETLSGSEPVEAETNVRLEETVETTTAIEQTVNETTSDEIAAHPDIAAVEMAPGENASAVAQPEVDSATALALRRLREKPLCCCGAVGRSPVPKSTSSRATMARPRRSCARSCAAR